MRRGGAERPRGARAPAPQTAARRQARAAPPAGLRTGLLTTRRRALFSGELRRVDGSGWEDLFDVLVCGDDVPRRKPAPDMVLRGLEVLGLRAGPAVWFIGDSTTDVIAARQA